MEINEIKALMSLLDDPDPEVQTNIREKIVGEGRWMIPFLQEELDTHSDDLQSSLLIQDIVRDIQIRGLGEELKDWKASEDKDLITGATIVARYEYPELHESEIRQFISKIRQDVWLELNDNLTAFEQIKVLNIVFFDEYGFSGNKEAYHHTENSFINKVIENRSGNPLLISILYMSVALQLEIPIRGVNLPNHFLVAFMDENGIAKALDENADDEVLFYINPFSNGAILHRAEIDSFLKHLDLKPEPKFYRPCESEDMIKRMLNNLIHAYRKCGEITKAEELSSFLPDIKVE
jgi:regulator of sirC expression with transglutaminase-like and TPR domain